MFTSHHLKIISVKSFHSTLLFWIFYLPEWKFGRQKNVRFFQTSLNFSCFWIKVEIKMKKGKAAWFHLAILPEECTWNFLSFVVFVEVCKILWCTVLDFYFYLRFHFQNSKFHLSFYFSKFLLKQFLFNSPKIYLHALEKDSNP